MNLNLRRRRPRDATSRRWRLEDHMRVCASREGAGVTLSFDAGAELDEDEEAFAEEHELWQ